MDSTLPQDRVLVGIKRKKKKDERELGISFCLLTGIQCNWLYQATVAMSSPLWGTVSLKL